MSVISDISDAIYNALTADKPRNGFVDPLPSLAQGNIRAWTDAIAPSIASGTPTPSAWVAVTAFTNSWVNYGGTSGPVRYRKTPAGQVFITGRIKSGVVGSAAFTLPAGFLPLYAQRIPVVSEDVFAYVVISTTGTVTPMFAGNAWVELDGLTFFTD